MNQREPYLKITYLNPWNSKNKLALQNRQKWRNQLKANNNNNHCRRTKKINKILHNQTKSNKQKQVKNERNNNRKPSSLIIPKPVDFNHILITVTKEIQIAKQICVDQCKGKKNLPTRRNISTWILGILHLFDVVVVLRILLSS